MGCRMVPVASPHQTIVMASEVASGFGSQKFMMLSSTGPDAVSASAAPQAPIAKIAAAPATAAIAVMRFTVMKTLLGKSF